MCETAVTVYRVCEYLFIYLFIYSEEVTTNTKKRRTVHEEIEEVQTINFFENVMRNDSHFTETETNIDKIHDPCLVPVENITLHDIGDDYGLSFNVTTVHLFS